jgi:hypothetical protein
LSERSQTTDRTEGDRRDGFDLAHCDKRTGMTPVHDTMTRAFRRNNASTVVRLSPVDSARATFFFKNQ